MLFSNFIASRRTLKSNSMTAPIRFLFIHVVANSMCRPKRFTWVICTSECYMNVRLRSQTNLPSPHPSHLNLFTQHPMFALFLFLSITHTSSSMHFLSIRILIRPRILESNESLTVTIQIQPLQCGYHEIQLRLINESYCNQYTTLTIMTVESIHSTHIDHNQGNQATGYLLLRISWKVY